MPYCSYLCLLPAIDANLQGTARRCGPGSHVHFQAVSHVKGISGIFRFVLPLRAQFSSDLPEILHEVS